MVVLVMEYAGAGYTWYLFRDTPHIPVVALIPSGRSGKPILHNISVIPAVCKKENHNKCRLSRRRKNGWKISGQQLCGHDPWECKACYGWEGCLAPDYFVALGQASDGPCGDKKLWRGAFSEINVRAQQMRIEKVSCWAGDPLRARLGGMCWFLWANRRSSWARWSALLWATSFRDKEILLLLLINISMNVWGWRVWKREYSKAMHPHEIRLCNLLSRGVNFFWWRNVEQEKEESSWRCDHVWVNFFYRLEGIFLKKKKRNSIKKDFWG